MSELSRPGIARVPIGRVSGTSLRTDDDALAVEEPLEIRLVYRRDGSLRQKNVAITMRTPSDDIDLALGFLFTEGLIRSSDDVASARPVGPAQGALQVHGVVQVELTEGVAIDLTRLERHFYMSSSCGVCGKASIEALAVCGAKRLEDASFTLAADVLHGLPDTLREAQEVFDRTGGLHAAALFEATGQLVALREDVGRHNAVDKLIGSQLQVGRVPLSNQALLVSGRASFELVQKSVMAGLPLLAAVGAPSSLAVELAQQYGQTLIGFLRGGRFNVYSGAQRIAGTTSG